jgi:glutaredoxin
MLKFLGLFEYMMMSPSLFFLLLRLRTIFLIEKPTLNYRSYVFLTGDQRNNIRTAAQSQPVFSRGIVAGIIAIVAVLVLVFIMLLTMSVNNAAPVQVTQTTVPLAAPQKSPRPAVDLYVMSFCPYGVQAETAMKPVVALLGAKADFRVRYIATVKNSTVEGIRSLHGIEEAKEDLRQLCVMKYYPDKFWSYIEGINAQCYPGSREPAVLDPCWRNVSVPLGIDPEKVTSCAYSSEGISMIKDDERITTEKQITGSPTLLINGQRYAGQRTAEAYKLAICSSFESPPVECNTVLSAQQAGQAAGACG